MYYLSPGEVRDWESRISTLALDENQEINEQAKETHG